MSEGAIDPNVTVSVEHDGRTLSGVGVSADALHDVMDRTAPAEEATAVSPPADATAPVSPTSADHLQPKPTRGQARFSELTQKAKDAQARAEAAERKAAELEARLAQAPAPAQSKSPVAERLAPSAPNGGDSGTLSDDPEPSEDEVGSKYAVYGDFVKAHGRWVVKQQERLIQDQVRSGIESHAQQQAFLSHVESTRAKGRAAYKDFDAMLQSGPGTYVDMPVAAVQHIFRLPNSEHVQYAIMRDGALAQRLAALAASDPFSFGLELSKIAPATPAVSTASTGTAGSATPPAPMQPVGTGSPTTSTSSAELAKLGNYEAYKAKRAAERGGRRR
jgi:hypothetical protein